MTRPPEERSRPPPRISCRARIGRGSPSFPVSLDVLETLRAAPSWKAAFALGCGTALVGILPVAPAPGLVLLGFLLGLSLPGRWRLWFCWGWLGVLLGLPGRGAESSLTAPSEEVVSRLAGRVSSHPRRVGEVWICEIEPTSLRSRGRFRALPDRILLELPAGLEPPAVGAGIRARGFLRRFPGFDNGDRSPMGSWSLRVKSRHLVSWQPPSGGLALLGSLRSRVSGLWSRYAVSSPAAAALGEMFLLGDRWAAPEAWREGITRAGLAHLIAASGFNVALIAGGAFALATLLPRRAQALPPLVATMAYLGLVGPEPSLLRASLMASGMLLGLVFKRPAGALQSLCVTWIVVLLGDPEAVWDLGFRLSVAATAGILLLAEPLAQKLLPWIRSRVLALPLGATLAAQAATAPDAIAHFGFVHPLAPLLNLLFGTLAGAALGVAVGATLLGLLELETAARSCLWLLDWLARPFASLSELPPSPWIAWRVERGLAWGLGWTAVLLAPLWLGRRGTVLACTVLGLLSWCRPPWPPREVEMVAADVGQGEAILVRSGRAVLLVDGGGVRGKNVAASVLVPLLAQRGISRVQVALLSHPDSDHCQGLADLARWIPIEEVWLPPSRFDDDCARRLASSSRRPPTRLCGGIRRTVGDLTLEVLAPLPRSRTLRPSSNEISVVVALEAQGRRVLLTGDLTAEEERILLARRPEALKSDILKVAHHGSRSSTSIAWLQAVSARLALISAGPRNALGHPHRELLARLEQHGVRVLRTDLSGAIQLRWSRGGPLRLELPGSPRRVLGRVPLPPTGSRPESVP